MNSPLTFSPHGIAIATPNGDALLNVDTGTMIIKQSGNMATFSAKIPAGIIANGNGVPWQPPSLSDAVAPNNSIYFSTTATKLVYKDAAGSVHNLY